MEDIGNEFSNLYEELYAEVEVQASSAIKMNGDKETSHYIPNKAGSSVKDEKEVIEDEGSDSEDDLNIVLNNSPINADQSQYKRQDPVPSASNSKGNNGFLLPRSSSILDVNIDTLEPKPWRHPGVDITDFFNFRFNEDEWKRYCKALQKSRASISEKQACKDSNSTHDRDSDVIEESKEDPSGSIKEELDHIDSPKHEPQKDNNTSYSSAFGDELSKYRKYLDENPQELGEFIKYIKRLKGLNNSYHGGKFLSCKESEISTNYSEKRFPNYQAGPACTKYQNFGAEKDQYQGIYEDAAADEDEDEYVPQQTKSRVDDERGARWKRKDEESDFRKTTKDYSFLREPRRHYDFRGEKYKRTLPYNSRNRDNWETYGRGKFKYPERSRGRYSSPPLRYAARRRLQCTTPPKNCVDEKYGRHERFRSQIWSKRFNGKNGYYCCFGRINDERHVHRCSCNLTREGNRGGNRFDRSCDVIRRGNRDQTIQCCGDSVDSNYVVLEGKCTSQSSKRCSDGGRIIYEHKHEKMDSNVGSELKALNNFNESHMGTCMLQKRSSDAGRTTYEGKHEKVDSNVDLELKALNNFNEPPMEKDKCNLQSSKRSLDGGRIMYENKHEKMDSNVVMELKALYGFSESPMDEVLEEENPEIEANQNREEWIDKIPVMQQKEALDIEEGQIIPEETSESSIDYITTWFRDPVTLDESGSATTSNLWMI